MSFTNPIVVFSLMIIFFMVQVLIIRWVLRINDMIFYLDKINEKLYKICDDKGLINKVEEQQSV